MSTDIGRGRHRAPGRHNPFNEFRLFARESAQPALKGAAIVAAAGGLVATFATPAAAVEKHATGVVAAPQDGPVLALAAPAAPSLSAITAIGRSAPAAPAAPAAAPILIRDVQAEAAREARRAAAKEEAARAARKAALARIEAAQAEAAREARRAEAKEEAAREARRAAAKEEAARAETATRAQRGTDRKALAAKAQSNTSSSSTTTVRASSGVRSSRNWATRGQCTWGALNMWYRSRGYYPGGWTGNAYSWASGAARAGYTVSGTPRAGSVVVMQPGVHGSSSAGHVGWVTSVSGNRVTIVEMNALAGAYNYNTRTLTDLSSMRYIYAP